ncbi:protein of unknown function [Aminobacter niigataensis]|nr:protein of unknown function [Aminobacter niigataensis]
MKAKANDVLVSGNPEQALGSIMGKLGYLEHHERVTVLRQQIATPLVISPALLTTRHSRDRRLVIEKADTLAMLALMIFHDEVEAWVKAIERQGLAAATPIWISGQKWKAMLTHGFQA